MIKLTLQLIGKLVLPGIVTARGFAINDLALKRLARGELYSPPQTLKKFLAENSRAKEGSSSSS